MFICMKIGSVKHLGSEKLHNFFITNKKCIILRFSDVTPEIVSPISTASPSETNLTTSCEESKHTFSYIQPGKNQYCIFVFQIFMYVLNIYNDIPILIEKVWFEPVQLSHFQFMEDTQLQEPLHQI